MPAVNRSFYTNMAQGAPYWTFISEELLDVARAYFALSGKRDETFVAGHSMGGYGAFKLALRCPGTFCAAASLSGVMDPMKFYRTADGSMQKECSMIFGNSENWEHSENNLFHLATKASKKNPQPRLYQCCGTEDYLYTINTAFRDHLRSLDLDSTFEEGPGGHEWEFWDTGIRHIFHWLPLPATEE
jgi:S-formylglutathione hydrolase FrmB